MWKERHAVNVIYISVWPTQAPIVDIYAEGSVSGLFNWMEIN